MKKIALIAILLCCAGILAARLLDYFVEKDKQTVYIALPGPMTGFSQEEGKAMLRGATLAYEQVKEDGKILKNKKIEIISYDDQNSQTAVRIASDIVAEDKVLLVLGHYTSTSCSAASPMYQGNGIPAITASAAVESATMESAWFFRTIPGTRAMTEFSIRSMQKLQKSTSKKIAMIYDANFYSTAAEEFKKKTKHLFDTVKIWPLKSPSDIQQIIAEIRAEQSVGPIFFFTESQDCASLIVKFRSPGTDYPIIGLNSLAVPTFIRQFKNYSNEQKYPGYYTNGAYAVSPFISYLADRPNARSFRKKFIHKFNHEPLWVAATYYDAMLVALHAIEQAEIQGEDIQEDRRKVRDTLTHIDEKDVAVHGVTGDIYFDEHGNTVDSSLALGFWWNHEFLPVYQQSRMIDLQKGRGEVNGEKGRKETGDMPMTPLNVVYAGIDINAIRNIDFKKGVFTADFYLWFRFQGAFDDTSVQFINAVHPVTLEQPILNKINRNNGVIVSTYRVIADFTMTTTDLDAYPLDRHTLPISFLHTKETRDNLIYVPDVNGMAGSVSKKNRGETMLEKLSSWEILEIVSRQDIEITQDKNKKNISYSRIDTEISIQRQDQGILLGKILLPFLAVIVFCFVLFYSSPEKIRLRFYILLSLAVLTFGLRILYKDLLPGQEVVHYMVNMVFTLIFFSYVLSWIVYFTQKRSYVRATKCILYIGSFVYLAAAVAGVVFLLNSHAYFS